MSHLRHKMAAHKAKGGKLHHKARGGVEHEYNAVGAPEMAEAHETKEGFKRGGAKKKKHGGHVEAAKAAHRLDKKPRRAAGGSVFSSASKKTAADKDEAGQGHEGDGPKGEDPDRGSYKRGGCATGGKPKNFIASAIKHPGALHKSLGVPLGEKIPEKKLEKATHSKNPTLRRRANLAKTLKGLRG